MFKSRYGMLFETVRGQEWRWEIPDYLAEKDWEVMDSECMVAATGVEFHFHLTMDEWQNEPVVGFYIHYKAKPIPKYSFALGTSRGRVIKQQTAHTIPTDTKRVGHKRVHTAAAVRHAVEAAKDGMLVIWFRFDDDSIGSTGQLGEFAWSIPHFPALRIGPFFSKSFARVNENDRCVVKVDVDKNDRSKVVFSVCHKHKNVIPCVMKFATPSGRTIHTTGECRPGQWPSLPYDELCHLDNEKTLLVNLTFVQSSVVLREGSQQHHSPLAGLTRVDADGEFNLLDAAEKTYTDEMSEPDAAAEVESKMEEEVK